MSDLVKKVTADIVEPCISEICPCYAEKLLLNDTFDLTEPKISKYIEISDEKYGAGKNLKLT